LSIGGGSFSGSVRFVRALAIDLEALSENYAKARTRRVRFHFGFSHPTNRSGDVTSPDRSLHRPVESVLTAVVCPYAVAASPWAAASRTDSTGQESPHKCPCHSASAGTPPSHIPRYATSSWGRERGRPRPEFVLTRTPLISCSATLLSCCCPGVSNAASGFPFLSQTRCSLVLNPPRTDESSFVGAPGRERPNASSPPFSLLPLPGRL